MENNSKYIIIALAVLIIALGSALGYMMTSHVDYERVNISNATTIEVPVADDASWTEKNGAKIFDCPSKHVSMQTINTQENFTPEKGKAFMKVRDSYTKDANTVESYNGYDIKQRTINDTDYYVVSISNSQTHDNILIISENLDILKHMVDSIDFGKPTLDANLTSDASSSSSGANANSGDTYTEDDLMMAMGLGYYMGYYDGYGNSYYDDYDYYDYYDDYDYYDYNGGSSSDDYGYDEGGSSVESTTDDYVYAGYR